ncbi:MAG: hypothetical protein AAGF98_02335 [Cyanobacteria bacterium P01_H01_bin.153]
MAQAFRTKARIQYSSQDELDVAVIDYCRGRSRHDLHARTRSALNGFYGPFAMAAIEVPEDEVRRQAMRSIRQLTSQILEIQEQFLPEWLSPDVVSKSPNSLSFLPYPGQDIQVTAPAHANGSDSLRKLESDKAEIFSNPATQVPSAVGPVDEQLREFLGDDAAIMAGLNPFINDLT